MTEAPGPLTIAGYLFVIILLWIAFSIS